MFDIGWSELVVIGIVALIAIGPKELPGVLRALGHWIGKIKRMAAEFQGQFQEAMREAEVADLKKQFDEAASAAQFGIDDPLETARQTMQDAVEEKPAARAPSASESGTAASGAATASEAATAPEAAAPPPAGAALGGKKSGAA